MSTVPPSFSPTRPKSVFLAGGILVLAAFATYHNSFSGAFIYDDIPAITDNPTIRQLWPLSVVLSPPSDSGITVNGRPLVNLSLAINYAIGGTDVVGYHVFNLAVHILAGLTLFGLLRRTLELPTLRARFAPGNSILPLALTVALLWTLHPLQTESVTYVIQRAESLVGLFYLLTLYCFVRSTESPRKARWQTLAVLACLCGMASKEVMASAPLLVLFYDRAFVSGTFRTAWQRHRILYLALALTWLPLGWLVANTGSRGGTAGFGAGGVSTWEYALTSAFAIGQYVKLTFWPSPLVFDYGTALHHELLPVLTESLLIVTVLFATAYALWRRPAVGFLGLWFFAILGPSSSFIPIASEPIAEHRMYLPLLTLICGTILGLFLLLGKRAIALGVGLTVGAGWLTTLRNEDYRDDRSIWTDTLEKYPSNARAHNNVGEILYRQQRLPDAIAYFREAVRLLPNYVDAINNLGNCLTQLGRPAEGAQVLQRALQLKPDYAETHDNLGTALYHLGQKAEAIARYEAALRFKPSFANAYNNLGVVLVEFGRYADAIELYKKALGLKPAYVDAHYNYANALKEAGQVDESIAQYQAVLRLNPKHAESMNNLGSIYFQQGKMVLAENHYRAAIKQKPNYPDALNNLGVILLQKGRMTEAQGFFETAVRIKPDYAAARRNLSAIHESIGAEFVRSNNLPAAKSHFEQAINYDPTNASNHNNLAVVLWRSGQLLLALPVMEEAVRLKPDFEQAVAGLSALRAQISAAAAPRE